MIIEGIKNLLGEDLTKQVETALKGKGKDGKDVDLVIGNDGSFVPAEKYNGANSGKTSAEVSVIPAGAPFQEFKMGRSVEGNRRKWRSGQDRRRREDGPDHNHNPSNQP